MENIISHVPFVSKAKGVLKDTISADFNMGFQALFKTDRLI